ncbi:sushi domain-containing protein 4 [Microcaecilia unicolor]|uniref:Sushi domain-containing protein 4 n=1 Tax=Microcaecilia unicolor TaxID=1415580 RepID=A0A6P7XHB4_9AMPH|nr:sushi domain-containing protein 4 [Microcaecilia unicolor]
MCHGMKARSGDPFLKEQQHLRLSPLLLWFQLWLWFGPAQLSVGFDDITYCVDPGVPENGYRKPSRGLFFENATVRFLCQERYKLRGPSKKQCVKNINGTLGWTPNDKPLCQGCPRPLVLSHSYINISESESSFPEGRVIFYQCFPGYRLEGSEFVECMPNLIWSDSPPRCLDVKGCPRPLVLSHSYINISESESSFPEGRVIFYQCFPGYRLEGSEFVECMPNLIWSDSPPRCLDVKVCPLPPMVNHGDYVCHPQPCEPYNHGTVVEFSCEPGYTLTSDYKYSTCRYGKWSPSYDVTCVKTEQSWPRTQETLLTTWKIVAFTATSVLLALLLVILARIFQTKIKSHFLPRGAQNGSSDPAFIVVDGVPVMLPSYDEAVSSGVNALVPGHTSSAGQGISPHMDDQNPPAYPGSTDTDVPLGDPETCNSLLSSSELLRSLYSSSVCQAGVAATTEGAEITGIPGEAPSTSPNVDIADETPLMYEEP